MISLLLSEDSVSLSCRLWLKEFKSPTLQELAKPLKANFRFVVFTFFFFSLKNFRFFVSLYKELLEVAAIVLDNYVKLLDVL